MKDTRCTKFLKAKQVNSCVASIFSLCTTNMSTPHPLQKEENRARPEGGLSLRLSTSCFACLESRMLHPLEIHINVYLHFFNNKFFFLSFLFLIFPGTISYINIKKWENKILMLNKKIWIRRYHMNLGGGNVLWLITISWRCFFVRVKTWNIGISMYKKYFFYLLLNIEKL